MLFRNMSLALVAALILVGPARAQTVVVDPHWRAIAVSFDQGWDKQYVAVGAGAGVTEQEAIDEALAICGRDGAPHCEVKKTWSRWRYYVTYDVTPDGRASWGIGALPEEALRDCTQRGGFTCDGDWWGGPAVGTGW